MTPAETPAGTPGNTVRIENVRFAVVDTETTGLSTDEDRVLQIGVVIMRGDGTVEHSSSVASRYATRLGFRDDERTHQRLCFRGTQRQV